MSAISSSSGVSSLFQFFSQLSGASGAASASSAQAPQVAQPTGTDPDGDSAGQSSGASQVAGHHHHHHGGHGGAFKKIESAVTSALQNATTDGSTDINQTIKDAITQALKDAKGGPTATGTSAASDPNGGGNVNAPGQSDNNAAAGATGAPSGQAAFFQTLSQHGVNPEQFRQDLLSAFQSINGGAPGIASSGQNAPTGLVVDTTA